MFYLRVWVVRIGRRETETCLSWKGNKVNGSQNVLTGNRVVLWILTEPLRKVVGDMALKWLKPTLKSAESPGHKPQGPFPNQKRCVVYGLWFSGMTGLATESLFSLRDQAAGLGTGGCRLWWDEAWAHLLGLLNTPYKLAHPWNRRGFIFSWWRICFSFRVDLHSSSSAVYN